MRWTAGIIEKEQGGVRGQGEVAILNERLLGAYDAERGRRGRRQREGARHQATSGARRAARM